jgi:hypothetical protein
LLRWHELFPTRGALAIALVACVLVPTVLAIRQIDANPQFSPIDEPAHFDYVQKVADGKLPRLDEPFDETTMRELACRGIALPSFRQPPCDTTELRPDQFSAAIQYEAQHPPTYYAVTAALRWVPEHVLGIDKLDATRAPNILWLVAGLLLLWAAGTVMAVAPLPLGAGLLLVAASPVVVYHTAEVTNDVTAVPAAGLVALTAALAYRGRLKHPTIVLFVAAFLASTCKATNAFAAIAVAGLLGVGELAAHRAQGWRTALRPWLRNGGALVLGALLPVAVWAVVNRSRSLVPLDEEVVFESLRQGPRTVGLVIREAAELFRPLTGLSGGFVPLSPDTLNSNVQAPLYTFLGLLLIGAGLSGLFVSPRRWYHVLGLISVASLYLGGFFFGTALMLTYDADPGLTGRYGLSLGALLALVLAAAVTGRWAQRTLAAFASGYTIAMTIGMFT